jgi:hypothetical protein
MVGIWRRLWDVREALAVEWCHRRSENGSRDENSFRRFEPGAIKVETWFRVIPMSKPEIKTNSETRLKSELRTTLIISMLNQDRVRQKEREPTPVNSPILSNMVIRTLQMSCQVQLIIREARQCASVEE